MIKYYNESREYGIPKKIPRVCGARLIFVHFCDVAEKYQGQDLNFFLNFLLQRYKAILIDIMLEDIQLKYMKELKTRILHSKSLF